MREIKNINQGVNITWKLSKSENEQVLWNKTSHFGCWKERMIIKENS